MDTSATHASTIKNTQNQNTNIYNHSFGSIIGKNDTVFHNFDVINDTPINLKIISVTSLTPCCSVIGTTPTEMKPGAKAIFSFGLKVGRATEKKRVIFLVRTNASTQSTLLTFTLTASIYAECETRVLKASNTILQIGQNGEQYLQLVTHRSIDNKLGMPNKITIEKPLTIKTINSSKEVILNNQIIQSIQNFLVLIPNMDERGTKRVPLSFKWEDGREINEMITWTVTPAIIAEPEGLKIKKTDEISIKHLIIKADNPFRVTGISSRMANYRVSTNYSDEESKLHRITLTFKADQTSLNQPLDSSTYQVSDLQIETDHPEQKLVEVTVLSY